VYQVMLKYVVLVLIPAVLIQHLVKYSVTCLGTGVVFISPYLEPDQDKSTCHYRSHGVYTRETSQLKNYTVLSIALSCRSLFRRHGIMLPYHKAPTRKNNKRLLLPREMEID
jgi:hypothetical protein